ncbi:MAG TPA: P1 family peptidase, partial [Chloroflexia bacterium]|nr:P1 family peptidase [Chloroflexia bacterium]
PDKALGRAALATARPGWFPLGAHGAGCSATVGKGLGLPGGEPGGQGAAFRQVGATRLAVFTVVNAVGAIVDRAGQVVRGNRDPATGTRRHLRPGLEARLAGGDAPPRLGGNTTLTVAVTNQRLDQRALRQWGRQVHSSMARAIQPFHTAADGDILYAVTTEEVDNPTLDALALGVLASELAWDAVLRSVDALGAPMPLGPG